MSSETHLCSLAHVGSFALQALLFAMDLNAQLYLRILTLFHNATEQCGHEFGARLDLSLEDSPSTSRATPSATQTPERSSTGACAQDANASVDAARADTDANARGVTAHAVTAHASSSTDPRDASAIGTNAEACESGDAEACESGESGGDDAQYVGSEDEVWSMLVRGYVRQAPSSAGADLRGVLRSRVAEVRDMSSKSGYERAAWARTELGKWLQEIKGRCVVIVIQSASSGFLFWRNAVSVRMSEQAICPQTAVRTLHMF